MYAITGATGHVGGAAARTLHARDLPLRRIVRDPARAGAGDAVADLTDPAALTAAFRGCDGAFVLLPTLPNGSDADHRRMADTIAEAVHDSAIPHVVALSSWGAQHATGTGPIRWLHHLERVLGETGAVVTAIRSPHFQEKVEATLGAAAEAGIHPVFGDSADVATTMAATRDIGELAATALARPPAASEIVHLDAPRYTERQVAERLETVLGTPLDVALLPREAWEPTLVDAGLAPALATELAAMYDAEARGLLQPAGDRRHRCVTELDDTLAALA
ncbi:uncharacterized protein YbjT (DUF2867 family) [Prauserella isguenensis]|uniref:Uncharacterized protein YbjT (DUF2867 family) n=1 Tax=Prauserella isguenensis TaxID=1470180 RepID=A0A839S4Q5_9PSEU|nr:NAD(P)H-binding protein [Prauserella isguenensis]MBB3052334.1 uncharacterized protein YbjT (DUF2867 family) [Prauserella isguenensis]